MGQVDLVNVTEHPVGRAVFRPGWEWSKHVKPIAQTESCETLHTGYFVSGHMKVKMDDGQEVEFEPGDRAVIPPGSGRLGRAQHVPLVRDPCTQHLPASSENMSRSCEVT